MNFCVAKCAEESRLVTRDPSRTSAVKGAIRARRTQPSGRVENRREMAP